MKKIFVPLFLFISVFVLYFGIATGFSFQSKWYLDYFNPLGQSIRQGDWISLIRRLHTIWCNMVGNGMRPGGYSLHYS